MSRCGPRTALLALAAVAAAALLAAPAQAQTTVWSATLTVGLASGTAGCGPSGYHRVTQGTWGNAPCSSKLDDADFDHGGTTYTITSLTAGAGSSFPAELHIGFSGITAADAKTGLAGLTLNVGTTALAIDDATEVTAHGELKWTNTFGWDENDSVAVSITDPTDSVAPTLSTATVNGDTLVLTYNEALDEDSEPANSAFTVKGAGADQNPTAVAVSGRQVTLTLGTAATAGQTVTVSYTAPGTNPIQDAAGNDAANLTDRTVTNHSGTGTIWSATLTVDQASQHFGCDDDGTLSLATVETCGNALTDDEFTHGGTTYSFSLIARDSNNDTLDLAFSGITGANAKSGLSRLALNFDGKSFNFSDAATQTSDGHSVLRWNLPTGTTAWPDGGTVELSIATARPTKLVSNTGQTSTSTSQFDQFDHAQAFTTGGNADGYLLTRVEFDLSFSGTPTVPTYSVGIFAADSSGQPTGSSLGTLTNPASLQAGLNPFTASGDGIFLAASTTYVVVSDVTTVGSGVNFRLTSSDSEDAGAASGWSIADGSLVRTHDGTAWTASANSRMIAVYGTVNPFPVVTITGGSAVTEGTAATFTLTPSKAPSSALTVNLTVSEAAGSDYVAAADEGAQTVMIAAGATTPTTYTVATVGDSVDEPNGSVTVAVGAGTGYGVGATASASVTVNDDDTQDGTAPTLSSAKVNGGTLVLTYNEALAEDQPPGASAFTVAIAAGTGLTPATASQNPTNVSVSGMAVTLTLGTAAMSGQVVTLSYAASGTVPIQDASGTDAADLTDRSVDNDTPLVANLLGNTNISNWMEDDHAQRFTTGGRATMLSGVELEFFTILSETLPPLTVSIHAIDGNDSTVPGPSLGTLTNPANLHTATGQHLFRFTPPSEGIVLAGNTQYFVVVDVTGGTTPQQGSSFILRATSDDEHAGATTGWSIADGSLERYYMATAWRFNDHGNADSVTIAVHGTPLAPALAAAAADRTALELDFTATLDANSRPAASAFSVSVDGTDQVPTAVSISGATVTLTLGTAVTPGQAVTVSYTAPGSNPLRDTGDTPLAVADFSAETVANNTPFVSNFGLGNLDFGTFSSDYAQAFTTGSRATSLSRVELGRRRLSGREPPPYTVSIHAAKADGTPGDSLGTLTNPSLSLIATGAFKAVSYAAPSEGITLAGSTTYFFVLDVDDTSGTTGQRAGSFIRHTDSDAERASATAGWSIADGHFTRSFQLSAWGAAPNRTDSLLVAVHGAPAAPTVASATVDGSALALTFDAALDTGSRPAASAFTVNVGGTDQTPTAVSISGATVSLTLGTAAAHGQTVTVSYAKPAANPLQDTGSPALEVADFSGQMVTNNTGALSTATVTPGVSMGRTGLELAFSATLDTSAAATPPASAFSVTVDGTPAPVQGVTVSGSSVTLSLGVTIAPRQFVLVSYDRSAAPATGSSGPLAETGGAVIGSFTNLIVANGLTTLVSTAGQSSDAPAAFVNDAAQKFTTGGSGGGYGLNFVQLNMMSTAATAPAYSVSVWNGLPGSAGSSSLGTLTNPAALSSTLSLHTFIAPAGGILLDAATDYWLVIDVSSGGAATAVQHTNSDAEDAGAAAGWSVADTHRFRLNSATAWNSSAGATTAMFAIGGHAIAPLVANTGQADVTTSSRLSTNDHAQAFTTGDNGAGYALTAVSLDLRIHGSPATEPTYTVQIYAADSNGRPTGSSLGTLTNPALVASGPNRFTTLGIGLAASTTYVVVADVTTAGSSDTSNFIAIQTTAADAEDAGAASGWSIADGGLHRTWNTTAWTTSANSRQIEVYGTLLTGPEITISGGQAVDEGTAAQFTVRADAAPDADLTVKLTVSESGSFVASGDLGSKTVTIGDGETSASYSVPTQGDSTNESHGSVTVTVNAGSGYTLGDPASASVTVRDDDGGGMNLAPVFTNQPTTASVNENSPAGTSVVTIAATDGNNDTLSYSLDATSRQVFAIDGNGAITVKTGATPNHEARASYTTVVTASDGSLSATHTVTISVNDLAEPPPAPAAPTVNAVDGNPTSLQVSWSAPSTSGIPAITGYDVRYQVQLSGSWNTLSFSGTTRAATITGLSPSTTYEVQVRARNHEGTGGWSPSDTGTTGAPVPPALQGATYSGDTVTIRFAQPLDTTSGLPAAAAFTVTVDGTPATILEVRFGSVILTLAESVTEGQQVTVAYDSALAGNPLRGLNGADVDSFGPQPVRRDTGQGDDADPPRDPQPLQLALWTERPGYRPGETVRLYRSLDPHDDRGRYQTFVYLERPGGGRRRYLAPLSASAELYREAVDARGLPERAADARSLVQADRELAFEGPAPGPGLWQFVLELRPGSPGEQPAQGEQGEQPAENPRTRRAWAKFAVAERAQLLNVRGFDRELREDLTLRSDTLYYLQHQLFVPAGATLAIEPGTVVQAYGRQAAIIVLPGGKLVAEGTWSDTDFVDS